MEVLNKKERLYSFLLFLALFLITMGVVISAVFFDYQVPKKELTKIRTENEQYTDEFKFQEKFGQKLEDVKSYIDKLSLPNEDFYYNHQLASQELVDLQRMIPQNDSLIGNNMYDNILLTYRELLDSKKQVNSNQLDQSELIKLRGEVDSYEREIQNLKRDLDVCRIINKSVGQ